MKKITLLLTAVLVSTIAWSQCTTGVDYQGVAMTNNGLFEVQSNCNYTGEYSNTTNVIDGDTYTFATSTGTDYITVTSSDGNVVYGFGPEPLTLTIDTSGDLADQALRVYYHDDAACGATNTCRVTAVRNDTVAADVCPEPLNFAASNITDTTADLSWLEQGITAVSYNVEVYLSGESAAGANTPVFADAAVSGLSVMATGLMATTDYDAYITTSCSGATAMSMLVGPVAFTTTAACSDVSGVGTANVADTMADVTWTVGTGNDSALVEVYVAGESAADGDTPVYANASASGGTDTATGLMADTAYDAYVTGFCGATSTMVQGPASFNTSPAPPACGGSFVDSGGVANDYSNNETITWTICPDNPGDVVTVNFTLFTAENNGTGCYDGLTIHNGPDATATTIDPPAGGTIWCWDRDDATPNGSGDLQGMMITSTDTSGCITFVFTSDGSVTREGWEAAVTCGPPPTCLAPTGLTNDMLTDTQVDFSWNDEAGATMGYEIEIGASGFMPGTGAEVASDTVGAGVTMGSFSSLTPETGYDIYVRSNCDANGFSAWAGPLSFTTLATPPANNDCANAITVSDGSSVTGSTTGATNVEMLTACGDGGGSAATGCPGGTGTVNFGAGVWYVITAAEGEVITATTDNSPTPFDTEIQVFSGDCSSLVCVGGDDDGGANAALSTFCWESSATMGNTVDYFIYVDGHLANSGDFQLDISVEQTLSIDELDNSASFTYYPNPVQNTLTLNAQNTIDNVTMYNMLGQEVLRAAPNTIDSELDMSSLQDGTYFVKVTIANITKTIRVIKQ